MVEVTAVPRLADAWRAILRERPEVTGCRVYGPRYAASVPAPGDGPALQVNAPLAVGARVHRRVVAALDDRGIRPEVALVHLLGVATAFGSVAGTTWRPEPEHGERGGGPRPVVTSRQCGLVLRFTSDEEAVAAWAELEGWRPAYGQSILDRSVHVTGDQQLAPRAAAVTEHQLADAAGRRLVYLSADPPTRPDAGAWIAADPSRFEFHQYLRWAAPDPPPTPSASVSAAWGRV